MTSIPAPVQRWVTILLPPLSIAVCCFVMIPRQKKLGEIKVNMKTTQAQQQEYLGKLDAIRSLPKDPRVATLPLTKQEQSAFLRSLSALCAGSGNRILSVMALAAPPPLPPPPPGSPAPAAPPPGALPTDVTEIKSTVVFEGNFTSLRRFLQSLQGTQRLISLTDCRIGPGQDGFPNLQTVLSVTRYVDAPGAATVSPVSPVLPGISVPAGGKSAPATDSKDAKPKAQARAEGPKPSNRG